jgi:hypothetical protein
MAKAKYDTVIQAVRYDEDGRILWVRAFKRLGPIWSDRILLDREALVEQLISGKQVVAGERILNYGARFEISSQVKLVKKNSEEIIIAGDNQAEKDSLQGVPLI